MILEIDHIVPQIAGGKSTAGNLVTCCRECNRGKGAGLMPGKQADLFRRAEPLTFLVSVPRSQYKRGTHCHKGHEFTAESTKIDCRGKRRCRICSREWERQHRPPRVRREAPLEEYRRGGGMCPYGHPYIGPNLYIEPTGIRRCRTCRRAVDKRRSKQRVEANRLRRLRNQQGVA